MYAKEQAFGRYDQFSIFSLFKLSAYIYSNSSSAQAPVRCCGRRGRCGRCGRCERYFNAYIHKL